MTNKIIQDRLDSYGAIILETEQDALKEILQEIALYSLSTSGFFRHALFHGGTSLRILHGLQRFSEDLDFILKQPNPNFRWQPYLTKMAGSFQKFGIEPEIIDRSKAEKTVQKMFLKDKSIGKLLQLKFHHHPHQKLMIKFEIDINPPAGSDVNLHYLEFPVDHSVEAQDLASNFAGKLHALLCRTYIKGRDWYDFNWYLKQKITPNIPLLANALKQQGPWKGLSMDINQQWLHDALLEKAQSLNWQKVVADVRPFVGELERESLNLWNTDFFHQKIQREFSKQDSK